MSVYSGRSVTPRREVTGYRCSCGARFSAEVWRAISAGDRVLRARLIEGELNRVSCPSCGASADVQVSVLYHDADAGRLAYVAPPSERHRELALHAELFALLAADGVPAPAYVFGARVVFGAAELMTLLAEAPSVRAAPASWEESAPDAITAEVSALPPRDDPTPGRAEPQTVVGAPPEPPDAGELRRGAGDPIPSRATVAVPDPRTAVIERWIAAREADAALFVDDRVVVCAALPASTLEHFAPRDGKKVRVVMRPQLHRMTASPLVVLTFIAGEDAGRVEDARVFHVPLDMGRAAHRVSLDALQRRCELELELFDTEYLSVSSITVATPLEEHLRHLVLEAKSALERVPLPTRSHAQAREAFFSTAYDWLGRTPIDLPALDEVARTGPAATRAALGVVARWSEPAAEGYLLEIRGYPLPVWRRLAATVVRRAIELGLFVPRAVAERVARRARAQTDTGTTLNLPEWPELIEGQIRRFAELSARLRPHDLSAVDEAANWEALLREAEAQGVAVDETVRRLAEASFERVGGQPSRRARATVKSPGAAAQPRASRPAAGRAEDPSPLSAYDIKGLIALLEDRDHRLAAAIELASRRESATLPVLFGLLRRLSRVEANALLPRIAGIGAPAERWLMEGLRSRKSFMRQGCALALGHLAAQAAPGTQALPAIDALVRLLRAEPTELWTEVARAVGDIGAAAVPVLAARLREAEDEERERVVQALSHVVSRDAPGGRAAVEELARDRAPAVAAAAQEALARAPEVREAHQAVRSERREQTLVRAFTRRFYDALQNREELEGLAPEELEALEMEELDESLLEPEDDGALGDEPGLEIMAGDRGRVGSAPTGAPLGRRPS